MKNAFGYGGGKTALVQFQRPANEDLPSVVRDRALDPIVSKPRSGSQKVLAELHGVSGPRLPATLEAAGLMLVDAYYDMRETNAGRRYKLVTFLCGREPKADPDRAVALTTEAVPLLRGYLDERWGNVTIRELQSQDETHVFHTIVFNGGVTEQIKKDRERKLEHPDFGLIETWSAGNVKPREDHVVI